MNAEDFLMQVRYIDSEIRAKKERIETIRSAATGLTCIRYDKDKVQSSMSGSKNENMILDYMDMEDELIQLIEYRKEAQKKVSDAISRCDMKDNWKWVLHLYYVNGFGFRRIANEKQRSIWTIYKWHKSGIECFEDTFADIVS